MCVIHVSPTHVIHLYHTESHQTCISDVAQLNIDEKHKFPFRITNTKTILEWQTSITL